MIKLNKSYKFRLHPNKEQELLINKTIGSARFIYNKMLSDKISYYNNTKEKLNNTPAQYKKEFIWLKEVDSLALANAQMNLQTAYSNFFRDKKVGFPKFKSKRRSKLSYTTNNQNNSIRLSEDNKYIKLPKLKFVRVKAHRQIKLNELIKSCTISKTPSGKYYVSISVEYEKEIINREIMNESQVVGLDFSMKDLYYSSEDKKANYPRYYRQSLDKLKSEQRKLSRKKKGSNNRAKQKLKLQNFMSILQIKEKIFYIKKVES